MITNCVNSKLWSNGVAVCGGYGYGEYCGRLQFFSENDNLHLAAGSLDLALFRATNQWFGTTYREIISQKCLWIKYY